MAGRASRGGGDSPPFPLTASSLKIVTLAFRARRYRSTQNCLAEAKRFHCEKDYEWPPSLAVAFRDAERISKNRLGPGHQARPFDPSKIASAYALGNLLYSLIVLPALVVLAGTLCLFRSAEVGALNCIDVALSGEHVAVRVSSSKTDVRARGVWFRWKCICHTSHGRARALSTIWLLCTLCLFTDIAVRCHDFVPSGKLRPVGGDTPFFRLRNQCRVTSQDLTRFLRNLDQVSNISLDDELGLMDPSSFSGHSLRRSGTQMWWH